MNNLDTFKASAVPFIDRAKLATLELKAEPALTTGTRRSERMLGTLHLPVIVGLR
jgi:hypothetical protein